MYNLLRPILFRLDPETAHALTLYALRISGALPPVNWIVAQIYKAPPRPVSAFGLTFKNPVGLAAGYDKDGVAIRGLAALGFGHVEIGTITPRPQPGNPKPRVFRLLEDEAVINRMGFPGKGMAYVEGQMSKVARRPLSAVIGLNLGKNKDTPLEEAANDYIELLKKFAPLADYLTINISSPNTVGLRRLQGREMLEDLLDQISLTRGTLHMTRPLLVKLAPDLTDDELDDAIGAILDKGMDGIIATNTTLSREGLGSKLQQESGGLSGKPLTARSDLMLGKIVKRVNGKVPIVSVGGIMNPTDAKRRLDMGAALIQLYTGLIYTGPGLVKAIVEKM
jgi:dihydroorotate dehydrogenase